MGNATGFCFTLFFFLIVQPSLGVKIGPENLLNLESCGQRSNSASSYIIGGSTAGATAFPWAVGLLRKNIKKENALYCGGSIIDASHILTAAHCIKLEDGKVLHAKDIHILVGTNNRVLANDRHRAVELVHAVSKVSYHSGYRHKDVGHGDDIALLKLSKPLDFERLQGRATPVCLPPKKTAKTYEKEPLSVAGWGLTKEGDLSSQPDLLQTADMDVITNAQCRKKVKSSAVPSSMMCTFREGGSSVGNGDSGGPGTLLGDDGRHYQMGVASFAVNNNSTAPSPSIFTRVDRFLDYIHKNVK